jgi:hypothetical protein
MAKLKVVDPMTGKPVVTKTRIPTCNYRYLVFTDDVLLEENDSPYKHKRFPLVQEFAYYTAEKDENDASLEPAGLIRDLKPIQREVNKHRSQRMHIVNTQANGIWLVYGTSTPEFDAQLKQFGTTPGAKLNVPPGVTKVERIMPDGISAANVEMEKVSGEDFYMISGINPETMGSINVPGDMSGVAIDRRQKASFMQVSDLADEANYSERLILDLLWGDKGRPGLIPQYFTEEMVLRIVGKDGENKFVELAQGQPNAVNQQEPQLDPATGQLVQRVLYDLSKFEFDIIVSPSQSTPTLMQSTLYQLIDAQKAGIPIPPQMLLEYMPINNKTELRRMMEQQSADADKMPPPKTTLSIPFKDLPIEGKMAVLAEAGIQVDANSLLQQQMIANPPKQPQNQAV